MEHEARTAVRAHQGQREGAGRLDEARQGDRREDGQQGARTQRRGEDVLPLLDARHLVRPARRAPLGRTAAPKGQTKEQLYNQAKRLNVKGRSRMNKQQLLAAVNRKK